MIGLRLPLVGSINEMSFRPQSGSNAMTNLNAEIEGIDRIVASDIKAHGEGEMHILHKERMVRVACFITDPNGYFTDEEAADITSGRRSWGAVERSWDEAKRAQKGLPALSQKPPSYFKRFLGIFSRRH
jgi:hypothetical protein